MITAGMQHALQTPDTLVYVAPMHTHNVVTPMQ